MTAAVRWRLSLFFILIVVADCIAIDNAISGSEVDASPAKAEERLPYLKCRTKNSAETMWPAWIFFKYKF